MQTFTNYPLAELHKLLAVYGLNIKKLPDNQVIAGSFWGESEAGLVGAALLLRRDTPVHSALHEACHYICMPPERRSDLHTDAGGDYAEENAVCYLQILLADYLPGLSGEKIMVDMDNWGYSFRLGSARAWFNEDADDAITWLQNYGLIDEQRKPTWKLRNKD